MNIFQMNGLSHPKYPPKGYVKLGVQKSIHPGGRKSAKFYGTDEYQKELRERSMDKEKLRRARIEELRQARAGKSPVQASFKKAA